MIDADYFDGRSARAHRVRLSVAGEQLSIQALDGDVARSVPLSSLRWPERQRHGPRLLHLADGASLQAGDAAAWDRWTREHGLAAESLVVRAQQSWRATLVASVTLLLLVVASYLWGLPLAASAVLRLVPERVDASVGALVYDSMQPGTLQPSRLPAARQHALRERFEQAAAQAHAGRPLPAYTLHFHAGPIGANALALPGGTLVLGDALVARLEAEAGPDADTVIVGVLAHELGHVEHRHGMRLLVQASLLGAVSGLVLGDFSSWLAALPALLGQLAYSRDFERAADTAAIDLLRANGLDPALMVRLFDVLAEAEAGGETSALASHPADAERRRRFEQASPSYNSKP